MVSYCKQDVNLTEKVYLALTEKMRRLGYSELSCEIEHKIAEIICVQEENGIWFNVERAEKLKAELETKKAEFSKEIKELFPPRLEPVAEYKVRKRKDGTPFAQYGKHQARYPRIDLYEEAGESWYRCYDWKEFNLGSPKQRIERLLELGWEPQEFTKKGSPKVDEDALVKFAEVSGHPQIKALADWLVVHGRLTMLAGNPETGSKGWLGNVRDHGGGDTRIHGRVLSCGATSRRMLHREPNCANVPSGAKAKYGKECRALWGVQPGKGLIQVGVDAAGLENVGLLHYLNNPKANEILGRKKPFDVHTMNAKELTEALGREIDREWGAKTCVPLSTKILTRKGWKFYNELEIGEDVLGYNSETKLKEWTKLLGTTVGEDEVIKISDSRRTLLATKNHRWFVRQRRMGSKAWSKINGRYLEDQVRTTDEINTESHIILNAPFNRDQDTISKISGLTGKYDVDYVQRVLDMSHAEREQFLQGFLLADGYMDHGHWSWSQNKNNIAEGLFLASYLVNDGQIHYSEKNGYNDKMCTVRLSKKSHITGMKLNKESVGIQQVWCPQTELGSWIMRQGKEIAITGNSFFALIFGAYPPKLGQIVKGPPSDGEIVTKTIIKNVPGFKELLEKVHDEYKRTGGLLRCPDGGYVRCPSLGASLNYLIQPLGAVVMKLACIILHEEAKKQDLWFQLLLTVHDEWQMATKEEDGDRLGKLAVWSIEEAARRLKLNVPLTGEYKLGYTWADCH